MITFNDIKKNEKIHLYIEKADQSLAELGYTEHSFSHARRVAEMAKYILTTLGYSEREAELAQIAGYMHDIGNIINRADHAQSGAVMAFRILDEMGMDAEEVATIITAIGNHDESTAVAVNPVAAALIISDKCDVRRSRVRNRDLATFDIHDRVNYSVKSAVVKISEDKCFVNLYLTIDEKRFSALEYFEIFIERMMLCRRAAEKLGLQFHTYINGMLLA